MKNFIIIILLGVIGFLTYDYFVKSNEVDVGFWQESKKEETLLENIKNEKIQEQNELPDSYEYVKVPKYEDVIIPFETVQWEDVTPIERNFGDIWFYTEENHNELIEDDFDWTRNDVLLLYVTNPLYRGHEIIVKELSTSTSPLSFSFNLVVDFKKLNNSQDPAKIYIVIKKDSLRKDDGEFKVDYRIYDTNGNTIYIWD
jgi:hypothetical protein